MSVSSADSRIEVAEQTLGIRRAAAEAHAMPRYWVLEAPALDKTVEDARKLAKMTAAPILVQGEPGSGVPEIARLVHDSDPAASALGFRSMPGYVVSPTEMRGWRIEGTLLIEDLQSLRPEGQEWLRGTLERGGAGQRPLRIVGASPLSVPELLDQPQLSRELVHALDVGRIVLPPLRERKTDIIFLARKFLRHYSESQKRPTLRFSREAEDKLAFHRYPANACELRNVVERAVALCTADTIEAHFITFYDEQEVATGGSERLRVVPAMRGDQVCNLPSLAEVERDYLILLIRELRGRRAEISRVMGVSYPTVRRKIETYGLDINAILEGP